MVPAGSVASGGVSVAYSLVPCAPAASRDACGRHPGSTAACGSGPGFGRRPVRLLLRRNAAAAAAARGAAAGELLRRSLRQPADPQPAICAADTLGAAGGSGPAFCVRSCDGKYFPLMRGLASPAQMCQAFCPASATKVYFGSSIDGAASQTGERYADSENAFAYRKALRADCTCNGREPVGLAPVDLALDSLAETRRRDRDHRRPRRLYRHPRRQRPDRGIHAGRLLSRPHRAGPRAARRDEGGAGARRDGRGGCAGSPRSCARRCPT